MQDFCCLINRHGCFRQPANNSIKLPKIDINYCNKGCFTRPAEKIEIEKKTASTLLSVSSMSKWLSGVPFPDESEDLPAPLLYSKIENQIPVQGVFWAMPSVRLKGPIRIHPARS